MAFTSQLPSGRWQGGFRHPVTKKKITKTFDYEYEAEAWAVVAEARAKESTADPNFGALEPVPTPPPPAPSKWIGPTIHEYGADYLERRAGEIERATLKKYRSYVAGLDVKVHPERPPLGEIPMGLLGKKDVQQWMTDSKKADVGRPTINSRLRVLRMLYEDLLDSDDAPAGVRNPTRKLRYLTEEYEQDHYLSYEEEAELLGAMLDLGLNQLHDAAVLAIDAGLRWQEVYGLRADALVGGSSYLLISHVIERGTDDLRGFTKNGKHRLVPTTERIEEVLARRVPTARKTSSGLLFPAYSRGNRKSDRVRLWDYPNHRRSQWLPALFAVGAAEEKFVDTGRVRKRDGTVIMQRRLVDPAYGFHSLRHTFGSRLSAAGVEPKEIQTLMGHASLRSTERYIHAGSDGRRLEIVRNIERSMNEQRTGAA